MNAGQKLRALREQLGLTIRDIENASARIAQKYGNDDYAIPLSRLSDIETKGIVPNLFKLYSLAVIYRRSFAELLGFYGIDLERSLQDADVIEPPKTHTTTALSNVSTVHLPARMDPGFSLARTCDLGRMIQLWGDLPLAYLERFKPEKQSKDDQFTYGFIGMSDFTMYPLLLPGSFVQVDESETKRRIVEKAWRSEYERPIYWIETRDSYYCCWCALRGDQLIAQPHPLSPVQPRIFKNKQDAEVVGQVVAVAMRLDQWRVLPGKEPRESRELN